MRIEVTEEDIKKGEKLDCARCPLALAGKRAFNNPDVIFDGAFLWAKSLGFRPVPENARRFVRKFETGEAVEPFSFEIT